MITVEKYSLARKEEWNQANRLAANGLFLFDRNYMDYHADRFDDHSLMFCDGGLPVALLPANLDKAGKLISHGGLTFGGLIRTPKLRSRGVIEIFESLLQYVEAQSFTSFLYKPIPRAFQARPSDDDLYALQRFGFRLIRRDLSSVVVLVEPIKYSKGRKWSIGKALKGGVSIRSQGQLDQFYEMLEHRLNEKYAVTPTHSREELALLSSRFPNGICIECAYLDNQSEPCAGITLYDYGRVLHAQYMATTDEGREIGALDFLVDQCIDLAKRAGKNFFSFGISTEEQGMILNAGLVQQKESFGAQGLVHDFYEKQL